MESVHQGFEVEPAVADDHELAVQNGIARRQRRERFDNLRKVAAEWPAVPALKVNAAAGAEGEAAKSVPLRFVEVVAGGQLARELGKHRGYRRSERGSRHALRIVRPRSVGRQV